MVAVRRSQARLEELRPARVPADHMVDLGIGHRHLRRQIWPGACPDLRIGGQAFADTADRLVGTVVGGTDEVELAQLRVDLQEAVVAVSCFDRGNEREQQILGRVLVGGEHQMARPLEVGHDGHF